jgi:hypothetical protein
MGRIIFNEDPNHFIYSRYTAGYKSITEKDCEDFILHYKDTDITDFMICVNASVTWYDCSCEKNIISQYREYCKSDKKLSHIHNTDKSPLYVITAPACLQHSSSVRRERV